MKFISMLLVLPLVVLAVFSTQHERPAGKKEDYDDGSADGTDEEDSRSQEAAGVVPPSHIWMLSLGLARLIRGVEENAQHLERQGEQVSAQLFSSAKSLENIHGQNLRTGRTQRQVRKDLQKLNAQGDRLWRTVRELKKELEDMETAQRIIWSRTELIVQSVKRLMELRSTVFQVLLNKQSERLSGLSSHISAQDTEVDRQLQSVQRLEKLVHEQGQPECVHAAATAAAALRTEPDSVSELHQHRHNS